MIEVEFLALQNLGDIPLPSYATEGAAGMDLRAAIDGIIEIPGSGRALIGCGFAVAIPDGYEAQIRPRSGLALKHGITVLNSPGTVDSDYRGEVGVILVNNGWSHFVVNRGDRIAQMVIAPVTKAKLVEVSELSLTTRAEGGFGSTGKS